MNRRELLTSVTALAGAALVSEAMAQSGQQITHVDTKTNGPLLQSRVVKLESLQPEGAAPGAKAYVHFNGPTKQLEALSSGLVTLEPGAQPHPPHQHPEEEFMLVTEGTGEIECDGVTTKVGPGSMMYCAGGKYHAIVNTGTTPMLFYYYKWLA